MTQRSSTAKFAMHAKAVIAYTIAIAGSLLPGTGYSAEADAHNSSLVSFEKQIQPIFEANCYDCHGAKRSEADLRLDLQNFAWKGSENGPVIIPGKAAESLLIHAIKGSEPDKVARMPKKKDPLAPEEIALIETWINQGAKYPAELITNEKDPKSHWAFRTPVRPEIPDVQKKDWPKSSVDNFVLARLEKENLSPSPEADKITLLRRLSLDLVGLPPTPEEVAEFLADASPEAYSRQVERLLNSEHYGERWARHWLDAARYADSDGYEKDKSRQVYFYRDWVVNALNKDIPYDQFIIDQLAGDLLPDPTQDQIVATGFLRHSMVNEEGGADPEQFRMDAMFDRMDAIGKSILGLTIQCAQCHNHKFDPVSQEEYYKMFAYLNNDDEPSVAVYTPQELMQRDALVRQIREIEAELQHKNSEWMEQMAAWEESVKTNEPNWTVVVPEVEDISTGGQRYLPLQDGSFIAQGYAPTKHTVRMIYKAEMTNITAFRLELLNDSNLPLNGPGRSFKGTSALTEFKVEAGPATNGPRTGLKFAQATADYSNPETPLEPNFDDRSGARRVTGDVKFAIDNNGTTAWGIDAGPGRRNQERKAVFQLTEPVGFAEGTTLHFLLQQDHGGWNSDDHMNNNLGRFRLSLSTNDAPVVADPVPKRVRDILAIPAAERSPVQVAAIFSYWRTTVENWKEANEQIEALWRQFPEGSSSLALMARSEPRETKILRRGDFLKPTRAVSPGVPSFMHAVPEDAPPTRLTFARWLADTNSPTTARVMVNRVWQSYFGTGLVTTPEDFGFQSEAPSHPELLDHLASEFMDSGWSLKALHRLIVHSATYRQSSKVTPEMLERDPFNRLLGRNVRLRVEGEIVRDIVLTASGLLNPKVGGPSVFPPAPQFLFAPPVSYAPFTWKEETGENRYRRGLYTFRRRSTPYPMLQTFDAPNGDASCVRRARSNTPLQALTSLNEITFLESAQALAFKTLEHGGSSDEQRLDYAFQSCLSRKPDEDERQTLIAFYRKQQQRIADGWISPWTLATGKEVKPAKLPKNSSPAQLAAWTALSRVLLNLDETIVRE
ncbi:MAG: PSD1 and planctomycete cytochrome C domain-containing protein [Verrucomicrobiales bacterium]